MDSPCVANGCPFARELEEGAKWMSSRREVKLALRRLIVTF